MQQESPQTAEHTPSSRDSRQASPAVDEDDVSAKITRKSHRKSRAGCKNCKTRRIKCDETKPYCANCKRRQVQCIYLNSPYSTSHDPSPQQDTPQDPNLLPISEIELTHYWTTTTSYSLSTRPAGALSWQALTMTVGLSHPHLLHLIFAFTALHLASCRPSQRDSYTAKSNKHYDIALSLLTPALANLNPNNCDAVLLSVQLVCFIHWARGPLPGEYLAFANTNNNPDSSTAAKSEWLLMFRGIRTTLESLDRGSFQKTHEPATRAKGLPLPLSSLNEPTGYETQLSSLREHVEFISDPIDRDDNIKAVDILVEMYDNRYTGKDAEYHVVFGWLYRMSDSFLARLERKDAVPLVLFAHFVVLIWDLERFWYMKGWTWHVMGGIWGALGDEDRAWVKWCMASVGWIEP
ncbi:hypothetical protein T440DRAFT_62524 [Plenodomus tracheiphilus IPT5]|uniref:Zn(2)-C6 fungal-type domain-containing protein n=1 Tax=Plenodomus tracheiphilus IPT5 TaxID=1408161 RepID=A0A6A7B7T3_9PLEO|nr:hypothetical protein T440DRAFT_62524 [Plenodomus tracheiphilus IPT5]